MLTEFLLLTCMALVIYHYVGYPLAVIGLARLRSNEPPAPPAEWPSIDLVIAAYDEESVIDDKLRNALSLDYPADRLRIYVVTDGSSDRTPDIVGTYAYRGVICLHEPERRGKANALNRAVAAGNGEIVVLSDANNRYSTDSLRILASRFARASIGGVTGAKKVIADADRMASTGDGLYWRYESRIKEAESELGGTVTGDGEIFAVRRRLFAPIPAGVVNDDMYITLRLVASGHQVAYEPRAVASEEGSLTIGEDFAVKVRMIAGGLRGALTDWRVTLCSGWFAVRFISHKLLRWLMPLLLAGILLANLAVLEEPVYQALLAAQLLFYATAFVGWVMQFRGSSALLWYVPFYFVAMNMAAAAGIWRFLRGGQSPLWAKARR